ncbi:DUF1295-domain-containing protein [Sporormia fimetaria CBS 119925]|uniref:DUF1295-domain-containing protein n=1 Tax=Sporormia fimetaria CBS 119925 TaxID=1340428 RepID=A0A6A6VLZ9_9PLEO|nr:DUF1295-domain-containing protein [Sporormia fimetaria CBS 119925]
MASGWFSRGSSPQTPPDVQVQFGNSKPDNIYLTSNNTGPPPGTSHVDTTHSIPHVHSPSLFDVGILKDTLAPSFGLHSGLAIIAWGAARYTGRLEAKDWLWPSGQVVNAWWSAVGRKVFAGLTLTQALSRLSWHERLVLSGVTLWGGRLFYRIAKRSIARGKDDPRYEEVKKEEDFWTKSLFTTFIPEAFFQMLISLPFTAPFRHEGAVLTGYHPHIQMLAVGIFSTGLALETLADHQLDKFKAEGGTGILREGVWSIVRNPNYLGDALVHLSFIVMLYGSDMLAPIELLGPLANYCFLRFFGGDKEKEAHQTRRYSQSQPEKFAELEQFKSEKNSFFPRAEEFTNKWLWTVLGLGGLGVVVEETLRTLH